MNPILVAGTETFRARAMLLGDRIDLRSLGAVERLAIDPLVVTAGAHGIAAILRYGAVVLFNVCPLEEGELLRQLRPLVQQPYATPEIESLNIAINTNAREGMEGGTLSLSDPAIERFQLVADILGKSTVLAMYEAKVTRSFDRIEPFARDLERNSQSGRNARELLRHIGSALLSEHTLVGRVEVVDKPEIIWEHPDLERFYLRLEDEFEIRERHSALERKLTLVSRTAQTVLELLETRRSLRVEWYIVALIVVEILLSIYQLFFHKG
jgi:uncharacterized Rmd1/YagE family protein